MTTLAFVYFAAGFAVAKATNWMQAAFHLLARAWRWRRSRAQFNELDAHALRDLGVDRSEFMSYCAESECLTPVTRRRVAFAAEQPVPGEPVDATRLTEVERRGARHARTHVCDECGKSLSSGHRLRALRSHRQLLAGAHVAAWP